MPENPFETKEFDTETLSSDFCEVVGLNNDGDMAAVRQAAPSTQDDPFPAYVPASVPSPSDGDRVIVAYTSSGEGYIDVNLDQAPATGSSGSNFEVVFDGSPSRGTTTTLAQYPGNVETNYSAVYHDGYVYHISGEDSSSDLHTEMYRYDTSADSWSARTDIPSAREFASASESDGKIYVAGGRDGNFNITNTLFEYDISSDSWATKSSMPVDKFTCSSVSDSGNIYVFGGSVETLKYDVSADSWSTLTDAPQDSQSYGAAIFNGLVYVNLNGSIYTYDISTDSWSSLLYDDGLINEASPTVVNSKLLFAGDDTAATVFHFRTDIDAAKIQGGFQTGNGARFVGDGTFIYGRENNNSDSFKKYQEPPVLHTVSEEAVFHLADYKNEAIFDRLNSPRGQTAGSVFNYAESIYATDGDELYFDDTDHVKIVKMS